MRVLIAMLMCAACGCTDADRAAIGAYGEAANVTCYSGGKVIYQGRSTGKVDHPQNSDGWQFKDARTGRFVRVSGPCVVEN